MKHAFRILFLALAAGCMAFASCGKDDPDPSGSDNNGGGNTPVNTVTFGDYTWPQVKSIPYFSATDNYTGAILSLDGSNINYPNIYIFWNGTEAGTFTDAYSAPNEFQNDQFQCYEYYEKNPLQDEQGYLYGDWWAESAVIEVESVANGVCTFSSTATMFSAADAFSRGMGIEAAERRQLKISHVSINLPGAKAFARRVAEINGPDYQKFIRQPRHLTPVE